MSPIRLVTPDEVVPALTSALRAGPAIAPVPPSESDTTLAMVRPEHPAEDVDLAVIVATSGSTGIPKGVLLTRQAIAASSEATHTRLGGAGDWTLALPIHYVAGLMVVARTVIGGTTLHRASSDLHDLPDLAGLPEVTAGRPRANRRQYLSLVPTQLVRALASPELTRRLARYDAVLLGGAATDPNVLDRAREAGIAIVTTYGMSETCGGCVYDGLPLPGVEVRTAPDSRLEITGPMLFAGYRLQPELTAAVLTDGWFRTSDRGDVRGDRVRVLGRVDDVVVSGGSNVDLAAVELSVRRIAGQRHGQPIEVVVVGVPDTEWGTRVVAVSEAPLTRDDLSGELSGAMLPRQVVVRTPLPRTSSGKIDRQALRRQLATNDTEITPPNPTGAPHRS